MYFPTLLHPNVALCLALQPLGRHQQVSDLWGTPIAFEINLKVTCA